MKKLQLFSLVVATSLALPSCMTTYDRNGRPVQSVDPALAVVGIIGAGLIGAAIASDNDDHYDNRRGYHNSHHGYQYQPRPCRTGPRHH
ncbi:MAG: hypothetical protein ACI9FG_000891 [Crocinitomicaceae bacterium]|jgi:hypothetical protein